MPIGAFRLNTLAAAMSAGPSYASASGGTVSYFLDFNTLPTTGLWKIHTFTTSGSNSFVVSTGGDVQAIITGGGGGGGGVSGTAYNTGGPGAGGMTVERTSIAVTPQTYTLSIGTGGSAGSSAGGAGGTGNNTTGFGFTAYGGGGGAGSTSAAPSVANGPGGGGGVGSSAVTAAGNGISTYDGGAGFYSASAARAAGAAASYYTVDGTAGGGGGGAASSGVGGTQTVIYKRLDWDSYGNYIYRGAPGGSPASTPTNGWSSQGGGVAGTSGAGGAGTAGTGGGGAGGRTITTTATTGGAGGSGVVSVRYQADPRLISLSYQTSATSTTSAITIPAGAAIGDIVFLFDSGFSSTTSAPTNVLPTGFTNIRNTSFTSATNGCAFRVSYKILVSGDPGASVTGIAGTLNNKKTMVVYRPSAAITQVFLGNANNLIESKTSDTAPSNNTLGLSRAGGGENFIAFAYYASSSTIQSPASTVTSTRDVTNTNSRLKTFESLDGVTTWSDSTISMGDGGVNTMQSVAVVIY